VWPSDKLNCAFGSERDKSFTQFFVPWDGIRTLLRFLKPISKRELFRILDGQDQATISQCLKLGLLVQSRGLYRRQDDSRDSLWSGFRLVDHVDRELSASARVVRQHSLDSGMISVIDDVFRPNVVLSIYRWFVQLQFRQTQADTRATLDVRHWVCAFRPVDSFVAVVPWWGRLDSIVRDSVNNRRLVLNRIHAYSVGYGDVQLPHEDVECGEGITAVYFGNLYWKDEWMSEMIFCDKTREPVIAVRPRPGRMVIFPAQMTHRAGVPSRLCTEPRFSVVFKYDLV